DDVWAVGEAGLTLHFDGKAWSAVASGLVTDFAAVWGASSHDVWAAGFKGSGFAHWDGAKWSEVWPADDTSASIQALGSTSGTDVWAAGGSGVYHLVGASWQHELPAPG